MRNALSKDRLGAPGPVRPPLGEVDHRLLGAAQIEGRPLAIHSFANRFHVGIAVSVEELQEQAEVLRVAPVGGRREQEHMVRGVAQQLAQLVAQALVRLVGGRHAVRLVNDDEIPVDLAQPGEDLSAFREVERGDDPAVLDPLIHAELVADVLAFEDQELGIELLLQLALPLEGKVCGTDDQNALGKTAQFQLADEQARHDGLARTGVVGKQEPNARELE